MALEKTVMLLAETPGMYGEYGRHYPLITKFARRWALKERERWPGVYRDRPLERVPMTVKSPFVHVIATYNWREMSRDPEGYESWWEKRPARRIKKFNIDN